MRLNKRPLVIRHDLLCPRMVQRVEEPFGVNDLRAEGARHKYIVIPHTVKQRGDFIVMRHHIRRDSSPVYGVDPVSGRGVKHSVPVAERPDVADLAVDARALETSGIFLKIPQRGVFKEIDNRDVRIRFSARICLIESKEGSDPCVKQLKRLQIVLPDHGLMGRVTDQRSPEFKIPDHGSRAVRVDLTELEVSRLFIIEQVKSRDRQEAFALRREKNQLFHFRCKRKQFSVILMIQVLPYHFGKNPVRHTGRLPEETYRLFIIDLRNLDGLLHDAVPVERGMLDCVLCGSRAPFVLLHVIFDMLFISFVYFLLQIHFNKNPIFSGSSGIGVEV